jgi:hypothetical protein
MTSGAQPCMPAASRAICSMVSGVAPVEPPTPALSKVTTRRVEASASIRTGSQRHRALTYVTIGVADAVGGIDNLVGKARVGLGVGAALRSNRAMGHGSSCPSAQCMSFDVLEPETCSARNALTLGRDPFGTPLVPAVERREVAGVPCLAEAGCAQVPVRADLAGHGAQVTAEVLDRRAAPEPVAVVDAVDDQPGSSTSVCGIIGSCSGSAYSWMSRSCWTVRSGADAAGALWGSSGHARG